MEIQKASIFPWKSTYPAITAISSAISQSILTKFGMGNLLGTEGVVVKPEFQNSESVAMENRNADFEALFGQERVGFCHGFPS